MEKIQNLIESYKDKVLNSYPSVFTKGDVTHLLDLLSEEIEKVPRETKVEFDFEEFREDIIEKVESIIDNYDFESSIELELSGREIEVSFNDSCSSLKDEIRDELGEFFDRSEIVRLVNSTESMI